MRPVLRPGLQLLRRDVRTVQLGHDWPGLALIPDSAQLRAVLGAIDGFRDVDGVILAAATSGGLDAAECSSVVASLIESGAVVDRARAEPGGVPPMTSAAWWLLAGPHRGGDSIAAERASCSVWVDSWDLQGDKRVLASAVQGMLSAAGLTTADNSLTADIIIATADGLPDRAHSDELMHLGVPHVWAHLSDLVGVIGPMVVPGESACLRCVDAARADVDPTWPIVVSSALAKPRGVPPCDPVLASVVAAWAVQEVAVWASGVVPSTRDSIIEVPLGLAAPTTTAYVTHPHCGCGWSTWQDTMGP